MSQPIKRVCIDADGVLAAFSKACCERCGIQYPSEYVFPDDWLDSRCKDRMWKHCLGYTFWFELEVFPWAHTLREIVSNHTPEWIYLTKPSLDPQCYAAKYDWIQKHFGDAKDRLWLANGTKAFCCRGPSDLLIDDALKNVEPWRAAGGTAFHWQEITPDYPADLVTKRLDDLKRVLKGES